VPPPTPGFGRLRAELFHHAGNQFLQALLQYVDKRRSGLDIDKHGNAAINIRPEIRPPLRRSTPARSRTHDRSTLSSMRETGMPWTMSSPIRRIVPTAPAAAGKSQALRIPYLIRTTTVGSGVRIPKRKPARGMSEIERKKAKGEHNVEEKLSSSRTQPRSRQIFPQSNSFLL